MASTRYEEEEESCCYAMQLATSTALSMSMQSAIELSVFDIIAKASAASGLSAPEIAAQIGTKNPEAPVMLDRILNLLACHSVLNCTLIKANNADNDGDVAKFKRVYSLNHVSKYFVKNDEDGVSLGTFMIGLQDKVFLDSWFQLKAAVEEEGVPFNKAHGKNLFEYTGTDPRLNQVFNKGMLSHATIVIKKILNIYQGFENIEKLVDVGGGLGVALSLITSRYPHIKGINYDLPHVIKDAPSYIGVEHVGGDMFTSVPKGNAIFIKCILHDWSDEDCLKLLKNCYNATPDNGKVIVVELLLPAVPETSTAVKTTAQFDAIMMSLCPGGKERSKEEFVALAIAAGFRGIRFECCACNYWVMEFFK